jgi:feruloyl-CoA synthase
VWGSRKPKDGSPMNELSSLFGPLFAKPAVSLEKREDGSMIMRSLVQASPPARSVGQWVRDWADKSPDRTFLAERPRPKDDWLRLSYAAAHQKVRAIAGWVLERGLNAERPLVVLSDNSIDHALLALAAMYVGVPVATISPAYSLMSSDHQKLCAMIKLLEPGAIYASDLETFAPALAAIEGLHDAIVVASGAAAAVPAISFDDLLAKSSNKAVDASYEAVSSNTIARFLFTSGSTGTPKAVINTHGMLTSNQEAKAAVWPFLGREPPVIVDWLPWSHTFGANHNFNMVLRNGGSLYIDGGRPTPNLTGVTAANLKDIGPNLCFNVPRGYDMLVNVMREDAELRQRFFSSVRLIFYAAAALPQNLWEAIGALSRQTVGRPTPMVSAWGSTETAPLATDCYFQADRSGNIGLPVPGVELKLIPNGGKLEIRVRGPNVTPGYWKRPDLTRSAFDEDGFYVIGDAVRFADPSIPEKGLFFDGRIAEDFKLSSGTFVSVGQLRIDGIAALDPIAQDIVLTGHDSDAVGFLIFPNMLACQRIACLENDASARAVLDHPAVRARLVEGLQKLKRTGGGSSRYAARARLLDGPPAVDCGEITDKGYINQRAVLENRAEDVALLNGDNPRAYVAIG